MCRVPRQTRITEQVELADLGAEGAFRELRACSGAARESEGFDGVFFKPLVDLWKALLRGVGCEFGLLRGIVAG